MRRPTRKEGGKKGYLRTVLMLFVTKVCNDECIQSGLTRAKNVQDHDGNGEEEEEEEESEDNGKIRALTEEGKREK